MEIPRNASVFGSAFREDSESEHSENRAVGVTCQLIYGVDGARVVYEIEDSDGQSHAHGHAYMNLFPH